MLRVCCPVRPSDAVRVWQLRSGVGDGHDDLDRLAPNAQSSQRMFAVTISQCSRRARSPTGATHRCRSASGAPPERGPGLAAPSSTEHSFGLASNVADAARVRVEVRPRVVLAPGARGVPGLFPGTRFIAVVSNFIISRWHVAILVVASIVAFIAGKWVVGSSVLVVAFAVGLFVAFMERWDRSRRGVPKSEDS